MNTTRKKCIFTKELWIAFIFFSVHSFAYGQETFQKTISEAGLDYCYDLLQTEDEGFMVAGEINTTSKRDYLLIKLNKHGIVTMLKKYGNSGNNIGQSGCPTSDGGYIIGGSSDSFELDNWDIGIIKTDSLGDTLWTKRYCDFGGSNDEFIKVIRQTKDGGYIIGGVVLEFYNNSDFFLLKTDSIGNVEWLKIIGSNKYDELGMLEQTNDSGFVVIGLIEPASTIYSGAYVFKTDKFGNIIWHKLISRFDDVIDGRSIHQLNDNSYIMLGVTGNWYMDLSNIFVARLNEQGDTLWTKSFGDTLGEYVYSSTITSDNGLLINGFSKKPGRDYDFFTMKIDYNGDTIWTKVYGGYLQDWAFGSAQASDGGYLIGGHSTSFGYDRDIYIVKTDDYGNSGCHEYHSNFSIYADPVDTSSQVLTSTDGSCIVKSFPIQVYSTVIDTTTLCFGMINNMPQQSHSLPDIYIYPNPVRNKLTIRFLNNFKEVGYILVTDCIGRQYDLIETEGIKETNGEVQINLQEYKPGIYLISFFSSREILLSKRIVKIVPGE